MTPQEKLKDIINNIDYFYYNRGIENYGSLEEVIDLPELSEFKLAYNNYLLSKLALQKAVENLTKSSE